MACFQTVLLLCSLTLTVLPGASCQSCPPVTIPTDICAIQNNIAALQQKVNEVSAQNSQLEQKVNQVTVENSQLKRELDQAKGQINSHDILLKQKRNQVAFSARVSGNVDYDPNQVIQFPGVIMNEGNRYNSATGIFTCGDSGLYVFTATILGGGRPTWFQIVQDGAVKANGYTGTTTQSSATHVAVVRCSPGSQVWVRRTNYQLAYRHTVWEAHSEFSGFRFGD